MTRLENRRVRPANLWPRFESGGRPRFGCSNDVVVHSLRRPTQQTFVMCKAGEFRPTSIGQDGDVDRCMKTRSRRDSALPNGVHQAERAKILEYARTSGPWDLAILRPPQRFKYRFVGIRGHLTSFLKCSYDTSLPNTSPRHQ
jgi:hypothetical protein